MAGGRQTLTFAALAQRLRSDIGQAHRYAHSVRVARLADRLAQRHGEDPARARMSGMLHDVARLWDPARLIAECEAREMPIDAFEQRHPIVLHARLGAEIARERYGFDDPAIHSAIARHTVAATDMSRLDTIVYLADALEPGRRYFEREALEALAFIDLKATLRAVLRSSFAELERRGQEPAPQSLLALAALERAERSPLPA